MHCSRLLAADRNVVESRVTQTNTRLYFSLTDTQIICIRFSVFITCKIDGSVLDQVARQAVVVHRIQTDVVLTNPHCG